MVFLPRRHLLPATLLFVYSAQAANDWSQACLSGKCSYDVVNGTASGTVSIVSNAIFEYSESDADSMG